MAITNNASYVPTIQLFLAHWAQVNDTLPAELVIADSQGNETDRGHLADRLDELQAANLSVIDQLNGQQIARGGIELQKAALLPFFNEFNEMVVAYWGRTGFVNARPKAPSLGDGQERFLSPMQDAANLWARINAAPVPPGVALPLTLSGGLTLAAFQGLITNLTAEFEAERNAAQGVKLARTQRDAVKAAAYDILKCYRLAVDARCKAFPELIESLPRLTPVPGGRTPAPVNASAVFLPPDQAQVVYEASTDPDLVAYHLRGNPGAEYDDEDAVEIATRSPEEALEFLTNFALNQPGAVATFKVFVEISNGNEAGSAEMTVERPA